VKISQVEHMDGDEISGFIRDGWEINRNTI